MDSAKSVVDKDDVIRTGSNLAQKREQIIARLKNDLLTTQYNSIFIYIYKDIKRFFNYLDIKFKCPVLCYEEITF